jgi:hypothetical protein
LYLLLADNFKILMPNSLYANLKWEHFDHGADIGIRGIGQTKLQAFEIALLALTAVITSAQSIMPVEKLETRCAANNDEFIFCSESLLQDSAKKYKKKSVISPY